MLNFAVPAFLHVSQVCKHKTKGENTSTISTSLAIVGLSGHYYPQCYQEKIYEAKELTYLLEDMHILPFIRNITTEK